MIRFIRLLGRTNDGDLRCLTSLPHAGVMERAAQSLGRASAREMPGRGIMLTTRRLSWSQAHRRACRVPS